MIVEQLPQIAQIQVAAIANIKFNKVVVMHCGGQDGVTTTVPSGYPVWCMPYWACMRWQIWQGDVCLICLYYAYYFSSI